MLLFLVFFPRSRDAAAAEEEQDTSMPTWKEAILVLAFSLAFFVVAFVGSIVFVYAMPSHIRGWANFLGLLATTLAAIQYFPQIVMTWRLQETGSLSVPMMCIQTPGSFVFAASLGRQAGSRWLERLGFVYIYRLLARLSVGNEFVVLVEGQEGSQERHGWWRKWKCSSRWRASPIVGQ